MVIRNKYNRYHKSKKHFGLFWYKLFKNKVGSQSNNIVSRVNIRLLVHVAGGMDKNLGIPSELERFKGGNNKYKNPFLTQIALHRTSEGGMARMARSSDTKEHGYGAEIGRVRVTKGEVTSKPNISRIQPLQDYHLLPDFDTGTPKTASWKQLAR